ncbi:MAG: bifunctional proline dehydrogenase/L-glutamate gamma-semialdehyde dehydrogenase PutA [Pseudomonadota bacterium]
MFTDRMLTLDARTYDGHDAILDALRDTARLTQAQRAQISAHAADLVRRIRAQGTPGLMEQFLGEYGLSTDEGIALMCLAEALLRVPDPATIDALIEDKIAPSDWGAHLGQSTSPLVNASTWALLLTGRVLEDEAPGPIGALHGAIKRLGEPVIRAAALRAMKEMGRQFVLGESIISAMKRAAGMEAKGYTYSYDMLGEAARTDADARRYHLSYSRAISAVAEACTHGDIRQNPGLSVKLSALHPRYEIAQHTAVMAELLPRLRSLCLLAKSAGMGLNVDAEEADRLSLSLELIGALLQDDALKGWDGLGVVVQAYSPRAGAVIDALYDMAEGRRIMVRLVKGAYWDTEIKRAQVEGAPGFPVFTAKHHTDISFIANARKLLGMTDRIYPQFATHNAHTAAAILAMQADPETFEFQRLHGMGEALHDLVKADAGTRCRIYAPVGAHRDLLAYLVRRLLENGANSSFVNQIVDASVPPEDVAADPFAHTGAPDIPKGPDLFQPERPNSKGFDLHHSPTLEAIETARTPFMATQWRAEPLLAAHAPADAPRTVTSPTDGRPVGTVIDAEEVAVRTAWDAACPWQAPRAARAAALNAAADAFEANYGELFALLAREAGKTLPDAVAELREAVDFLRYYAAQSTDAAPLGRVLCISPWNFPLAIFTGQIAAALAAGNAVLAKPAEQTPLIAYRAVQLMHAAGIPTSALQLLPGGGATGALLTAKGPDGVAFTGSTATAQTIRRALPTPGTPMIAETGGLNAMIVDSTALPEQAIQAVIESAFQSAGQRCSALRCLYVQDDIADNFTEMLKGAMDALRMGDPWHLSTDTGPVIDEAARTGIADHISASKVLHSLTPPEHGTYIPPTLIEVPGIEALEREIFGPVLHIARFKARDLDKVIEAINATGYGLTFGLHTRIDDRVQHVADRINAGNVYVNRNQIGAIVGSQPFGGTGLSGTGPKAGGPHYVPRFSAPATAPKAGTWDSPAPLPKHDTPFTQIAEETLPGPTGESNRLSLWSGRPVLCLGPGADTARAQAEAVRALGGYAVEATGEVAPNALQTGPDWKAVLYWGDDPAPYEAALAARPGPIIHLLRTQPDAAHVLTERHICIDTTASGGNAALLAETS